MCIYIYIYVHIHSLSTLQRQLSRSEACTNVLALNASITNRDSDQAIHPTQSINFKVGNPKMNRKIPERWIVQTNQRKTGTAAVAMLMADSAQVSNITSEHSKKHTSPSYNYHLGMLTLVFAIPNSLKMDLQTSIHHYLDPLCMFAIFLKHMCLLLHVVDSVCSFPNAR